VPRPSQAWHGPTPSRRSAAGSAASRQLREGLTAPVEPEPLAPPKGSSSAAAAATRLRDRPRRLATPMDLGPGRQIPPLVGPAARPRSGVGGPGPQARAIVDPGATMCARRCGCSWQTLLPVPHSGSKDWRSCHAPSARRPGDAGGRARLPADFGVGAVAQDGGERVRVPGGQWLWGFSWSAPSPPCRPAGANVRGDGVALPVADADDEAETSVGGVAACRVQQQCMRGHA
jgi:hypothetical protein